MISEEYKKIYTEIHEKTKFGKRSKIPDMFGEFLERTNPTSILDFGCGKGNLVSTLNELFPAKEIFGFDPANPEYDISLRKVDLLLSTDVLEHIEPDLIDQTLKEIADNCTHTYHLISCAPAKLILPDGRNAHLIQETPDWWRKKFLDLGFTIYKEHYVEFEKFSKQLNKSIPVKNYFIMGSKNI
jgi:SAM-dependent methyltransferase